MVGERRGLTFSCPAAVRAWLEHGAGKPLLEQLTAATVARATADLTQQIAASRLSQRQLVLVVLESDGQLREVYGTDNVRVAVRALLVHDEATDLEAEEYLTATLPYGFRTLLDGRRAKLRTAPLLGQTAELEEARLNRLAVLGAVQDGTWRELVE